jgi:hypothetical protein
VIGSSFFLPVLLLFKHEKRSVHHIPDLAAPTHSTGESPTKRDALFFLANSTFRVYFALSNLRLCDTVLNNTNNSNAVLDFFPKADRVAFLYYRGRIALYQRRLPQARNDLRRAFALSHANGWKQGRYDILPLAESSSRRRSTEELRCKRADSFSSTSPPPLFLLATSPRPPSYNISTSPLNTRS